MPTRSYYFPQNFEHLEKILQAEPAGLSDDLAFHFKNRGIAPIPSAGSLSLLIGISPKIIFSIRKDPRKHYRSFFLQKKDGSRREIDSPRTYLKVIQWWILDNILNKIKIPENIFGFVAGRSAIQNAEFHMGAKHVLNVDIKQFFPSITIVQVHGIFCSIGYPDDVANVLSELCCLDDRVPQGAPTSPALANLVLREFDEELLQLSNKFGYKYSRYADDLTFSSQTRIERQFLTLVQNTAVNAGFRLKPQKTRFSGAGGRMEVTGVVINDKMQPLRTWRKRTRATIYNLTKTPRLTRRNLSYLFAIRGMASQFPDSIQMQRLAWDAQQLLEAKSSTVIGHGDRPVLPNGLTIRQAEALAALVPRVTNLEISVALKVTEEIINKRLQSAFKKIDVDGREAAERWASANL